LIEEIWSYEDMSVVGKIVNKWWVLVDGIEMGENDVVSSGVIHHWV